MPFWGIKARELFEGRDGAKQEHKIRKNDGGYVQRNKKTMIQYGVFWSIVSLTFYGAWTLKLITL